MVNKIKYVLPWIGLGVFLLWFFPPVETLLIFFTLVAVASAILSCVFLIMCAIDYI